MSFVRRCAPRVHPFPEDRPFNSCQRCGSATGGVIDGLCASCDGRIADAIAGRTTTVRGTPAPGHLPADPDDVDTVVVDPPPLCSLLVAFVDGELEDDPAQAFRAHLASCPACDAALVDSVRLSAQLSTLKPT